jgi:DNA invertase Pin-like site-specific DNA recombinase
MRAAIYSRLSRESGSSSLARQRSSCEEFCASRAWTVVGHYVDNDVSAYRVGVRRPEFERLLEDVSAGAIDVVVVFKIDRLVRRPFDFERFWEEAELGETNLASVTEPVDSSTPHGVAFIRILVALAGLESATTGLRIVSLRREEARSGKAGPASAYGFTADWSQVVDAEAALVRQAAGRVLGGERISTVAADWRARRVPGPGGRPWTNSALNRILHNPRIAGDRAYRGQVVVRDCFPAILDHDTFDRLQTELGQPHRRGRPVHHPPRLASGLIFCSRCGAKLMQTTRTGRRFYSCPHPPTGCARLHVNADLADSWLREALCKRLGDCQLPAPTLAAEEVAARLAVLSTDYYAHHAITRAEFLAARADLEGLPPPPTRDLTRLAARVAKAPDPSAALQSYGTETQRVLLRAYVNRIEVLPAARRGFFNPDRLQVLWREDASA